MKKQHPPKSRYSPGEEEIRSQAYRRYEERGCVPGHEVEDWLAARARLEADGPLPPAGAQLALRGDTTPVLKT